MTVYAGLDLYGFFPREGSKAFPANHNLAVAYAKMGNYEEAYKQELKALASRNLAWKRAKWVGHLLMTSIHLQAGNDFRAMQNLKAVLILNPRSAEAYKAMADIYYRHGAKENADMVLKVALNLNVTDKELWNMLKEVRKT